MNYLNSKERNAVASLLLTVGVAEDILRSKNTTKEEAKKLKKIQEWSEKYMDELFKRVPEERQPGIYCGRLSLERINQS